MKTIYEDDDSGDTLLEIDGLVEIKDWSPITIDGVRYANQRHDQDVVKNGEMVRYVIVAKKEGFNCVFRRRT
jgi:hypothetical protein